MTAPDRRRLVLCGSNYGASYLPVIDDTSPFELAGIFAKGSERSVRLASQKNVPLWSAVGDIPDDVSIAIIAIPPPAAEKLSAELMDRGIHVLAEHPIATDVLRDVRARAERATKTKIIHHVNCHFAELSAPRSFIEECARRAKAAPVKWISVMTAPRSAYATFDLLGRALGRLSDSSLENEPSASIAEYPFVSFAGTIGGIPARVQCSKSVAGVDDGSDSPVPQRVEIGFENGNLLLVGPVGPVVWSEKLRLALRGSPDPLWTKLFEHEMTFMDFMKDRMSANRRVLAEFDARLSGGAEPVHQATAWLSTVAELMKTVRATEEVDR